MLTVMYFFGTQTKLSKASQMIISAELRETNAEEHPGPKASALPSFGLILHLCSGDADISVKNQAAALHITENGKSRDLFFVSFLNHKHRKRRESY